MVHAAAAHEHADHPTGGLTALMFAVPPLMVKFPVAVFVVVDVLVTFENEVALIDSGVGAKDFDAVYPSMSLLAAPPVTIVDKVVDKRGTRKEAQAYLDFLYSPAGQEIIAQHHLRPRNAQVLAKHASEFKPLKTFTVEQVFGSWQKAQQACSASQVVGRVCLTSSSTIATTAWLVTRQHPGRFQHPFQPYGRRHPTHLHQKSRSYQAVTP